MKFELNIRIKDAMEESLVNQMNAFLPLFYIKLGIVKPMSSKAHSKM